MSGRIEMLSPNVPQCNRVLYRGLRGGDVEWLQETLEDLNSFYKFCPTKTPLKATGFFGDDTVKFLKFFQYYENIIPDSFFDRTTCEKMKARWDDYIDIQMRSQWKYSNINEYLSSRFED